MTNRKLRPYQKDIIQRAINSKGNILIQAPTGAGKTLIAENIVNYHQKENKKILFLAPKINLLSQTKHAFINLNPQVIHESNKKEIDLDAHAFVSTIQTISKRTDFLKKMNFDYIILDEMHYGAKGEMQKAIRLAHTGKIIGLSATPYDADGKLLTEDFDTIIDDYDTKYMVNNGYLVNIKSYETYLANLEGVKTKSTDWDLQELDIRFNRPEIVNKIVSVTKDIIEKRKKTIVFCINISHAEAIAKAYENVNIKVGITHSKIKKDIQEKVMNEFKNGELKALVSIDQLTTGFDVPSTDTIVLARPTKSQNLYKQIVGRALRLSPQTDKKEAILLDCAGVISRLGMPLEPIIEIIKQDEIVKKPYYCKKCKSVKPRIFKIINDNKETTTICPDCEDSIKFKPKFIYKCEKCNRYYDFKNDYINFNFENEEMSLNCLCGHKNKLGSLNDDEINFRELSNEIQKQFNIERLSSNNIGKETLDELSDNNDSTIRSLIFNHKNTSADTLIKMAKENFDGVDAKSFLDNKKITKENLLEIVDYKKNDIYLNSTGYYKNKYYHILKELLIHNKCTTKIINNILEHKDLLLIKNLIENIKSVEITKIPKKHYMEKDKFNIVKLDDKIVKNVESFLEKAIENSELKIDIAKNKYISLKLLEVLAKDKDQDIKRIIQSNPNFKNEMLNEDIENQDYYSRLKLSTLKGLDKETQLKLAKSKEDNIKTNLLKNYKSHDLFFACLDSIPLKDEKINEIKEQNIFDIFMNDSKIEKFITQILGSKHCDSTVLKHLIQTKHSYFLKGLKEISKTKNINKYYKEMISNID